jgi:4'-phosphopantetheinyl transferase
MTTETVHLPIRPRPLPERGRVDVWLTRLGDMPLDAGPRGPSRRERVMRRRVQQQFFQRLLLAAYLGCPGKAVKLVRSDRGKPMLAGEHADSALQFNASHSGDWLAVAVAKDTAIGIDIETERRLARAPLLARRFLSGEECEWLVELDEPFRSRQFLRQWTAREALVKARGCGLAGCLGEMALGWQPPSIRCLPADWDGAEAMTLASLPLPDGLVGHLASLAGPLEPSVRRIAA